MLHEGMGGTLRVLFVILMLVGPRCSGDSAAVRQGKGRRGSSVVSGGEAEGGEGVAHRVVKGASNGSRGQGSGVASSRSTGKQQQQQQQRAGASAPSASALPTFMQMAVKFASTEAFTTTRKTLKLASAKLSQGVASKALSALSAVSSDPSFSAEISQDASEVVILFTPQAAGAVSGDITVATSAGDLVYPAQGVATDSRYKISPITDVVVPAGSTYKRSLSIFNPHPKHVMHIVNCTTENLFVVVGYTPGAYRWTVRPLQQEVVASISLLPLFTGPLQGRVRVVVSLKPAGAGAGGRETLETLDIPISCLAVRAGVFSTRQVVDFGKVASLTTLERTVVLMNTLHAKKDSPDPDASAVLVSHIEIERGPHGGASDVFQDPEVTFLDTAVPSGGSAEAFKLTLHAPPESLVKSKVSSQGMVMTEGTVVIHYTHADSSQEAAGSPLRLPYKAIYIPGNLEYNIEATLFPSGIKGESGAGRGLVLTNNFNVPIQVTGTLLSSPYFSIQRSSLVALPASLKPGESLKAFSLKFASAKPLFVGGNVTLFTNLTDLVVPLQAYHGRLGVTTDKALAGNIGRAALAAFDPVNINLGLIHTPQSRQITLYLTNPNPVPITIKSISDPVGERGGVAVTPLKIAKRKSLAGTVLAPRQVLAVSAKVVINQEGEGRGGVVVKSQGQSLNVNIGWQALVGQASFVAHNTEKTVSASAPLKLGDVLMASRSEAPVFINSTYSAPLTIMNITSNDRRVQLWISSSTIVPKAVTEVGRVVVVADAPEGSIRGGGAGGTFRRKTLCADDIELYKAVQAANTAAGTELKAVISVVVSTSEVAHDTLNPPKGDSPAVYYKSLPLHVTSVPQRAEILTSNQIDFGMIEVGRVLQKGILVRNKGHVDMHVHLLRWADVPTPQTQALAATLSLSEASLGDGDFYLPPHAVRRAVVPPGEEVVLGPVVYEPSSAVSSQSVYIVRNSITGVEGVSVTGKGGQGVLRLIRTAEEEAHHGVHGTAEQDTLHLGVSKTSFMRLAKQKSRLGRPFSSRGEFVPWTCLAALLVYGVGWMNTSYLVLDHFHGAHHVPEPISQSYSDPVRFSKTFQFVNAGNYLVSFKRAWLRDRTGVPSCEVGGLRLEDCEGLGRVVHPGGELSIELTFTPDFTTDSATATLWLETPEGPGLVYWVRGVVPRDQVLLHHDNLPHTLRETLMRTVSLVVLLSMGALLTYRASSDVLDEVFPGRQQRSSPAAEAVLLTPSDVPVKAPPEDLPAPSTPLTSALLPGPTEVDVPDATPTQSSASRPQTPTADGPPKVDVEPAGEPDLVDPTDSDKYSTNFPGFVIATGLATPTSSHEPSPVNSGSFSSKGDRSTTPSSAPSSAVGDRGLADLRDAKAKKDKKKKKERDRAAEEEARRRLEAKVRKEQEERRLAAEAAAKAVKEKARREEEDMRRREVARARAEEERRRVNAEEVLRSKAARVQKAEQKERQVIEEDELSVLAKLADQEGADHTRAQRAREERDRQREANRRAERERKESERQKREADQRREREERERERRDRERQEKERVQRERDLERQRRERERERDADKKWFDHGRGKPPTTNQFYQQGPVPHEAPRHMRGKGMHGGYGHPGQGSPGDGGFGGGNGHKHHQQHQQHQHYQQEAVPYWEPSRPQPPTTMHPPPPVGPAMQRPREQPVPVQQQQVQPAPSPPTQGDIGERGAVQPPPLVNCTFSLFDQPAVKAPSASQSLFSVCAVPAGTRRATDTTARQGGSASASTSSGTQSPSNPWLPINGWGDEWHPIGGVGRQAQPDAGTIGTSASGPAPPVPKVDEDAGSSLFTAAFLRETSEARQREKEREREKEKDKIEEPTMLYELFKSPRLDVSETDLGMPLGLNLDDVLNDFQSDDSPQHQLRFVLNA